MMYAPVIPVIIAFIKVKDSLVTRAMSMQVFKDSA